MSEQITTEKKTGLSPEFIEKLQGELARYHNTFRKSDGSHYVFYYQFKEDTYRITMNGSILNIKSGQWDWKMVIELVTERPKHVLKVEPMNGFVISPLE